MVATRGATTQEILALADEVIKKVFAATAINVVPEVTIITTTHKKKF
jgi:UDP-N-acetylenolpyruvoylglucosamine reductase